MNVLLVTRNEINVYKPMDKPERRMHRLITVSCIFANDTTFASRTVLQDQNKPTLVSIIYTYPKKSETVDENTGKIFPNPIKVNSRASQHCIDKHSLLAQVSTHK